MQERVSVYTEYKNYSSGIVIEIATTRSELTAHSVLFAKTLPNGGDMSGKA